MYNRNVLGLPGNLPSAILANATYGLSFAFLVILAQLVRYDWRLDEAAMVFGARPLRTFWEVTLPSIWPAVLGAFLVSFILGFNNFEISFYNLGAVPTLPTVAWGTLRHGIEPELYALATLVNLAVFVAPASSSTSCCAPASCASACPRSDSSYRPRSGTSCPRPRPPSAPPSQVTAASMSVLAKSWPVNNSGS